jgi:hypothetical protein
MHSSRARGFLAGLPCEATFELQYRTRHLIAERWSATLVVDWWCCCSYWLSMMCAVGATGSSGGGGCGMCARFAAGEAR